MVRTTQINVKALSINTAVSPHIHAKRIGTKSIINKNEILYKIFDGNEL